MAAVSSRSPRTASAPACSTAPAELSERASARTVQPSLASLRISAPPTKPEPPVTNAVGMTAKLSLLGGLGPGPSEVGFALLQDDRLPQHEVAYADLAGSHLRQRAVAAVVGQPGRPANGRRREAARGPERALAASPQVPHRLAL